MSVGSLIAQRNRIQVMLCAVLLLCAGIAKAGTRPQPDAVFPAQNPTLTQLGWQLFYDPILSGGKEVACASCHHPRFATGDGLSLGLGDGAKGLGDQLRISTDNIPEQRIGRHAPTLFNLGAEEFSALFHDGRLQLDQSKIGGIRTPLGAEMIEGFSGLLSAQSMFPVLSGDEMAGHYTENDIAQAVGQGLLTGPDGAWQRIADRVVAIDAYRLPLESVYGVDTTLGFVHVSNALAAFMAVEWRSDDSPFDRYLRGDEVLSDATMRGMDLFYGKAACDSCHSGQFQTDHDFHAIAMPQLGPGKAARFERHSRDVGRQRVTGAAADAYAFRTPSLRNVVETGPYGHAGAYATLEAVVRHHLDPPYALRHYDRGQVLLPDLEGVQDWQVMDDPLELAAIAEANELPAQSLSNGEVNDLIAFLASLSDTKALRGRLGVPDSLHSGLPVPE